MGGTEVTEAAALAAASDLGKVSKQFRMHDRLTTWVSAAPRKLRIEDPATYSPESGITKILVSE